ncbi:hypothetical protein BJ742DRAFT_827437 [Cladochytrium replicatum]|nr:hypothetical protein BJ742DRAFT_827437 [Cladochytrium replicatum]
MVLLNVKRGNDTLFLFQTETGISLKDLNLILVKIHNRKLQLKRLIDACEELIEYGPMKPLSEHGYSEDQLEELAKEKENETKPVPKERKVVNGREVLINKDPTGRRCGECIVEEYADIVQKTLSAAKDCISPDKVKLGECLTNKTLKDAFDNIRGAVMIVYPMGLPEWEPVRDILEDVEDLSGTAASKEVLLENETSLWWASKELSPEKILRDYIGRNEKTTVVIKLQKKGQGAPMREPPINEEQQKQLIAYYYRKQEVHKQLAENEDDDYLYSQWANPKSLKNTFNGVGTVSWRPQ